MEAFAEYERKLLGPRGFELPQLQGEPLEPRLFTSFYYDTDDLSLSRARITLRRRVEHGESEWQLKLPRADDRLELSAPGGLDGPPSELAQLLLAHTRHDALRPVAELRTRRRGELVTNARITAEVTIDEVAVMDALRVADEFVEIEVELKSGDRAAIEKIVHKLERAGARDGESRPKLFRALSLPSASQKPGKSADSFTRLRTSLGRQLAEILRHDPGTRLGSDLESLHDMRVALRRARALLAAGRRLTTVDSGALQSELQWAGEVLGAVRDLDVMLAHLRHESTALDAEDRQAVESLLLSLEKEREAAQSSLIEALESDRYFALLDRYERTVAELEPAAGAPSLATVVGKQFSRLQRSMTALGDDPPDAALHEQRKRGKRARYSAELAGYDKLANRAKSFQDILGQHQDAAVLQERLRALAASASPAEALAAGRLLEREQEGKRQARAAWPTAWKALRKAARGISTSSA